VSLLPPINYAVAVRTRQPWIDATAQEKHNNKTKDGQHLRHHPSTSGISFIFFLFTTKIAFVTATRSINGAEGTSTGIFRSAVPLCGCKSEKSWDRLFDQHVTDLTQSAVFLPTRTEYSHF